MRIARYAWTAMAAAALTGVVTAAPAGAHALVRSSDPASGALLEAAPSRVVVTFTEPPDVALSSMHVLDSSGRRVETGKARAVASSPLQLSAPVGRLEKGVYTVTWRVVSRVDGHLTAGSFAFGFGVSPAGATLPSGTEQVTTPPPSALAVAGRWLLYAGIALLLGYAATTLFVFRRPGEARWLLLAASVSAASGLVLATVAEASAIGISVTRLLASSTGTGYARQFAAAGVAAGIAVIVFFRPSRASAGVLGAGVAALIVSHVVAGHAGGSTGSAQVKIAAQTLHVLVAGMWIGGLVWLALGLRDATNAPLFARRFSVMAGYLIALVALTGAARVLDLVGSWSRLWSSSYGTAVLIKVGLFLLIGALGALNRWRHVPALNPEPRGLPTFKRAVATEIVLAAVVFGATGAMAGLPPPSLVAASTATPDRRNVVVTGADFATSVRVRLTVTPGTAGPNTFEARVADYDTGRPTGATRVALRLSLPSRPDVGAQVVELAKSSDVSWRAESAALAIQGTWNIAVIVEKPSGNVEIALRLRTRLPPQDIAVSRQAGQPTLYTITLSGGRRVQAYLDPGGRPGRHDVHFTFFTERGSELPMASALMTGTSPDGEVQELAVRRFGTGHFVATVTVTRGRWLFGVDATTRTGDRVMAYVEQDMP